MKTKRAKQLTRGIELSWSHCGELHCVTAELLFVRDSGDGWTEYLPDPSAAAFSSAADMISETRWLAFLDYMPAAERELLGRFSTGRLAALAVVTRCPQLIEELLATPALVPFLAEHVRLRGTSAPRWEEINAVYERDGLYGVLGWLGLPASKQTIAILQRIAEPDLARRLLEPLRTALWEPETIWLLQHTPTLTEQNLQRHVHALAA